MSTHALVFRALQDPREVAGGAWTQIGGSDDSSKYRDNNGDRPLPRREKGICLAGEMALMEMGADLAFLSVLIPVSSTKLLTSHPSVRTGNDSFRE